jgi:hypothetical protein
VVFGLYLAAPLGGLPLDLERRGARGEASVALAAMVNCYGRGISPWATFVVSAAQKREHSPNRVPKLEKVG